jgi:cobalt-zinc-cadmium efflux system outer membrane protein
MRATLIATESLAAMSVTSASVAAASVFTALLAGCSGYLAYEPADLEVQAAPTRYLDRSSDDSSLAALVRASGYAGEWPPDPWRLDTLTLTALYFNPELDVARAQALTAQAELAVAARRSPLGITLVSEHHSRIEGSSPWSLGVAIELPIGTRTRREARAEKAALLADAAEIEIASAAWRVRSAVRDALIDLMASSQRTSVLRQRLSIQRQMEQLVQRRVEAGMLSSRDLGMERIAVAGIQAALALEDTRYANARGDLARALGLPLKTVQSLRVADDALTDTVNIPDAGEARYRALHNRLDIHTRLLEFGAADAEVRLAIAEQYPTVSLSPGYLWDQADNVWFLLADLALPSGAHDVVRVAEARRETAARRFSALQINVIGEVEQAGEVLRVTQSRLNVADEMARLSRSQFDRARRFFESGGGDRVRLVAARLADAQARQHLLDAREAWQKSIARFEDATQYPFLSDFLKLPESRQSPEAAT